MKKWVLFSAIIVVSAGAAFGVTRYLNAQPAVTTEDVQVSLFADRAEPSATAVERGKAVVFNTKDDKIHDIGQGSGKDEAAHEGSGHGDEASHEGSRSGEHEHTNGGKESGPFGKGQAYRVVFDKIGTYTFHDHLNPKIRITVVVYEPNAR